MTAPTTAHVFINRDGGMVVDGACEALPPLLNPFALIAPPHIIEGVCMFHLAVPVHMRADVVYGRRADAANDGLGFSPTAACGSRIQPHHMYDPSARLVGGSGSGSGSAPLIVKRGKIADVTCRLCRRVATALSREAPPSMRERLAWQGAVHASAPEMATLESFAGTGKNAA